MLLDVLREKVEEDLRIMLERVKEVEEIKEIVMNVVV